MYKKIVIIDVDNVNQPKLLLAATSLYTKDTLIVPVGLKRNVNRCDPNGKKWDKLDDWFRFMPNNMKQIPVQHIRPDASDMTIMDYIGKNLIQWKESVEDIVICSDDVDVFNISIILRHHFRVWMMVTQKLSGPKYERKRHMQQLGLGTVPLIVVKGT